MQPCGLMTQLTEHEVDPSSFSPPTLGASFQGEELEGMEETIIWDNGGDANGKGGRENNEKRV